jgi:hypothetical protein
MDEPKESEEIFDPFKGYDFSKISKEDWFNSVPYSTLARNAYYQGFITEWEHRQITAGKAIFLEDGHLRWIKDLPDCPGPHPDTLLTKTRMLQIQADYLLGIGKGETSLSPNKGEVGGKA